VHGKDGIGRTVALVNLADVDVAAGEYTRACDLLVQATELRGERDMASLYMLGMRLFGLGEAARDGGDAATARTAYQHAAVVLEAARPDDEAFPYSLLELASVEQDLFDLASAEEHFAEGVAATEALFGRSDPRFGTALILQGQFYVQAGRAKEAEATLRKAVETLDSGADEPTRAWALSKLGSFLLVYGRLSEGEPLLREARHIRRELLGEQDPAYADSLLDLAEAYADTGSYQNALELAEEATSIYRTARGTQDWRYGWSVSRVAGALEGLGDHTGACERYREAIGILEHASRARATTVIRVMNNLAVSLGHARDFAGELEVIEKVVALRRERPGDPELPPALSDLAICRARLGDLAGAEQDFLESLRLWEHLDERPPSEYVGSVEGLANIHARTARPESALELMQYAAAIDDQMLSEVLSIGAEPRQLAYERRITPLIWGFLSVVATKLFDSTAAVGSALDLVLSRRGLVAEIWAARLRAGRYHPELAARLEEIARLRVEYGATVIANRGVLDPAAHESKLHDLAERREQLEAEVSLWASSRAPELTRIVADHEAVAAALPVGSALIELVRLMRFDVDAPPESAGRAEPRYYAFALRAREPESTTLVDLGNADEIDALAASFQDALAQQADEGAVGEELARLVVDPLRPLIGDATAVLIVPDGSLTSVPFEAFPTGAGRLLDEYNVGYLSSGRDVLRFGREATRSSAPLVLADPDYDLTVETDPAGQPLDGGDEGEEPDETEELRRAGYPMRRLPGTRREGETVASMLGVAPLLGADAVEGAVKAARSPRVLHLATHGFFRSPTSITSRPGSTARLQGPGMENPLLCAGVALAGFNTWFKHNELPDNAEDGLLNGEDIAALDLLDTELVVLSACETGLGESFALEGVVGLRRSLMVAGAATAVMSLWRVDDDVTELLMTCFYRALFSGSSRAEALREAKQAVRAQSPHPYYWSAFIAVGDPGPMSPSSATP
jgi:CHAT domain-containing protein/tetratricopeptide (TPR) repeat protein